MKRNEPPEWMNSTRLRAAENEMAIKAEQRCVEGRQSEPIARIWRCRHCGHFKSKWTTLSGSTRYWSLDDRCGNPACVTPKGYGRRTRNILLWEVCTAPTREAGKKIAAEMNRRDGVVA